MIILGPRGAGKSLLAKTSDKYVELKTEDYEFETENWVKRYVGTACLLSDVGYDVLLSLNVAVLEEVEQQECGALIVLPKSVSENTMKTIYEKTKDSPYLHAVVVDKYITEEVVEAFRSMPLFRNNTSKFTFLWGLTDDDVEEADAYTDNYVSLFKDKATGEVFLDIDDGIIEDNDVVALLQILNSLKRWYRNSYEESLPVSISTVTLDNLFGDLDFTVGETLEELIVKLGAFLLLA